MPCWVTSNLVAATLWFSFPVRTAATARSIRIFGGTYSANVEAMVSTSAQVSPQVSSVILSGGGIKSTQLHWDVTSVWLGGGEVVSSPLPPMRGILSDHSPKRNKKGPELSDPHNNLCSLRLFKFLYPLDENLQARRLHVSR